jgi:hypothetical protein
MKDRPEFYLKQSSLNIFSVKVPKNQAARYLAFEELLHFRVLRGSLS